MKEKIKEKRKALDRSLGSWASSHTGKFQFSFFPLLMLWLELSIHLCDGSPIKYIIIYGLFALSFGCIFGAFAAFFRGKGRLVYCRVISFILTLIFLVEFVAKEILQTYYPASILG
ncbi:MAG: hypothetical protein IJM17_01235, partial [Firmicutes bacterium]|nr:hypothetical protein [Bacillota bacterium]